MGDRTKKDTNGDLRSEKKNRGRPQTRWMNDFRTLTGLAWTGIEHNQNLWKQKERPVSNTGVNPLGLVQKKKKVSSKKHTPIIKEVPRLVMKLSSHLFLSFL